MNCRSKPCLPRLIIALQFNSKTSGESRCTGSGGNNYSKGNLQKYALPETAPKATGQLFNLAADPGETKNLFFAESSKRRELQALLRKLTPGKHGRSAPKNRVPLGIENIPFLKK